MAEGFNTKQNMNEEMKNLVADYVKVYKLKGESYAEIAGRLQAILVCALTHPDVAKEHLIEKTQTT